MRKKRRSRKKQAILRHIIQAAFFALTNGYMRGFMEGKIYRGSLKQFCVPGLNCYSCPGALFSCPIGSLQAVLDSGGYRISLYVLGFLTVCGALCGRLICGFLCPFGLVQDLLYRIPLMRKIKNLPGHRLLRHLRYAVLLLLVVLLPMTVLNEAGIGSPWFCEYLCPSGTLLAGIPSMIYSIAFYQLFLQEMASLYGLAFQPAAWTSIVSLLPGWGWTLVMGVWNLAVSLFYLPAYQCVELGYFETAKTTSGVGSGAASNQGPSFWGRRDGPDDLGGY